MGIGVAEPGRATLRRLHYHRLTTGEAFDAFAPQGRDQRLFVSTRARSAKQLATNFFQRRRRIGLDDLNQGCFVRALNLRWTAHLDPLLPRWGRRLPFCKHPLSSLLSVSIHQHRPRAAFQCHQVDVRLPNLQAQHVLQQGHQQIVADRIQNGLQQVQHQA